MQAGYTPLTYASYSGHPEAVQVLVAHKADVNAKTNVSRHEGEGCEGAPMGG